ncbi:hypothetical protein HMPREF9098_0335 [Kingella denitrificans ATCC 33394]|uniref:Uncharacterized protein n=1 Tax=Kingella denitrificans ATCC 33394 TaxID=888741 RepID=F0EWV5_9NEIS|nr:hypothetical protein HMPREF9098_0335 [Kingella denitrificans ATCC 33394]
MSILSSDISYFIGGISDCLIRLYRNPKHKKCANRNPRTFKLPKSSLHFI